MHKITLVLRPDEFTSFTSWYLDQFWRSHFNIEWFDENKTYKRHSTIFVVWWMNINDPQVLQLQQQGYKVAVDHLWEQPRY